MQSHNDYLQVGPKKYEYIEYAHGTQENVKLIPLCLQSNLLWFIKNKSLERGNHQFGNLSDSRLEQELLIIKIFMLQMKQAKCGHFQFLYCFFAPLFFRLVTLCFVTLLRSILDSNVLNISKHIWEKRDAIK